MRPTRLAAATAVAVAAWWPAAGSAIADPDPSPPPAPTRGPAPGPAPKTAMDHDGIYAVGTDIVAGTYRTDGPTEGKVCYWKRVRGDQLVDNNMTKKSQVVQIEPTDTAFKTSRCQPWQLVQCPPTCADTPAPVFGMPPVLKDFEDRVQQAPPAPGGH